MLAALEVAQAIGEPMRAPWLMMSVNDDEEDPHFRKAVFDPEQCPSGEGEGDGDGRRGREVACCRRVFVRASVVSSLYVFVLCGWRRKEGRRTEGRNWLSFFPSTYAEACPQK